jgi:Kelch motif/Galactose oxidase, central domain
MLGWKSGLQLSAFLVFAAGGALLAVDSAGKVVRVSEPLEARFDHTATRLANGDVLLAGGMRANGMILSSAEVFHPDTSRFTPAGSMASKRDGAVSAVLPDGRVLIAGGWDGTTNLRTAEVYDPAANRFSPTGSMTKTRDHAEAVILPDRRVLVMGGDLQTDSMPMTDAEIFDPETGRFSATGAMQHPRSYFKAVLMKNGRVLAAGGFTSGNQIEASAEVYDPASGGFHQVSSMANRRYKLGAAALPDGKVLVIGGADAFPSGNEYDSTEVFDPVAERFSPGPSMHERRYKLHSGAATLADGSVLVAGGSDRPEKCDRSLRSFQYATEDRLSGFYFSSTTLLKDGAVLIDGGYGAHPMEGAVKRAWLYQP